MEKKSFLIRIFTCWAKIVTKCTLITMILSVALFAYIGFGFFTNDESEYGNETAIWTPEGNLSVVSMKLVQEFFGDGEPRFVSFIFEAKGDDENILTKESF